MSATSRVRVYVACSLDGFIAGPDDDLSWLAPSEPPPQGPAPPSDALEFNAFLDQVGSMLMGRRTHDVVAAMGVWPYGDIPVLVATTRPLEAASPSARPVRGDIAALMAQAKDAAGDKDVYIDGGDLIRQAIDAGLVDELCITFVPILLGDGIRLFDGLQGRTKLHFLDQHMYGEMLQVTMRPQAT